MISRTSKEAPRPFSSEELAKIKLAQSSFQFFLMHIYPESFRGEKFRMSDGKYHDFELSRIHYVWAGLVEQYDRVCILAPRAHLKSTVINHAYIFWRMFSYGRQGSKYDAFCMSYKDELAASHTEKLKDAIKRNTYCRYWESLNITAKSVVDFQVKFSPDEEGWRGYAEPHGVFSNIRGEHPRDLVCDDILSDFANPLLPTQIKRIHQIYTASLESVPTEKLILIGTPQSYEDTLYKCRSNKEYFWARFPARFEKDGQDYVQWPEKFSDRRLKIQKRRVGPSAFKVEYMLLPFLAADAFLPQAIVEDSIDYEMKPYPLDVPFNNPNNFPVYGGMDVGKMVHPTHVAIYVHIPNGDLIQVFQAFLDHMNYRQQAKFVTSLVDHFGVKRFLYDSTRAELDDRVLSKRVQGQKFTKRTKAQMAVGLEMRFVAEDDEPGIILLPDKRQVNQIVSVNRELQSLETEEGHGDSFWSNALAVRAAELGPVITILGDAQSTFGGRARRVGRGF